MEFGEKLQRLRKDRGLTQDELADRIYVSRTAISKWESNRGLPSIDSLKVLSKFFDVSIDTLLSDNELFHIVDNENKNTLSYFKDLIFGLLDCCYVLLYILPIFGLNINGVVKSVSLLNLSTNESIKILFMLVTTLGIIMGLLTLSLQKYGNDKWNRAKINVSLGINVISMSLFILTKQPYAGFLIVSLLFIKLFLLLKAR